MRGGPGSGTRMAGRIIQTNGTTLYRFGQVCNGTYGKDILCFRIDTLNQFEFQQTQIEFPVLNDGRAAWNSVRRHHIDALPLLDGSWLAVMDGDRQASNPLTRPFRRRLIIVLCLWTVFCVFHRRVLRETLTDSIKSLWILSPAGAVGSRARALRRIGSK